jgi:hypothetical protein
VAVGDVDWYCELEHVRRFVHSRLVVAVGAFD